MVKDQLKFLLLRVRRHRRSVLPLSASFRTARSLGRSLLTSHHISAADDYRSL
jgi:hypothetical protein